MDARVRLIAADERTREDFYTAVENAGFKDTRRFEYGSMIHVVPWASPCDITDLGLPMVKTVCENR